MEFVRKNAIALVKEGSFDSLIAKLTEPLDDLKERLDKLSAAVYGLNIRGYSMSLFTLKYMTELRKEVQKTLQRIGFESLAESTEDFYRSDFSHLRTSSGNRLVILHIPVVESKDVHHLFYAQPIPMPLPLYHRLHEGPEGMVLPILDNKMIVISKENKSNEVSYNELIQKCSKYFSHYICKELDNDMQESCLGSLFIGHTEGTHEHCHFGIFSIEEFSFQMSETQHIVVTANPIESKKYCTLEQRKEAGVNIKKHIFFSKCI